MQKSVKGFTMLVVLFFLQLISLLTLYELLHTSDNLRKLKKFHAFDQSQYDAKVALIKIENNFLKQGATCEIEETPAIFLQAASMDFWQQKACVIDVGTARYYYVVERLIADSCALIADMENNQQITAQYYRITLFWMAGNHREANQAKIILQSTLAKAGVLRLSCASGRMPHKVYLGSQMRRILTA